MKPDRPSSYRVTPGCTHGKVATYAKGCRCRGELGGVHPEGCTGAWRDYRREKQRAYRRRVRAETHPTGCMCRGCILDRKADA